MKRSLEAAFVLARRLHPSKIEAITSLLLSGASESSFLGAVGSNEARVALTEYLDAIKTESISNEVAAAILTSSSHTLRAKTQEQSIELVVTGPDTPFVATRRTEQVLLDLIRQAKHELFLVSFVANNWRSVINALVEAVARGVTIRVLMEASKEGGGTLDSDQTRQLVKAIPKAQIYRWAKKNAENDGGKVHAKIALADNEMAFVTSANFTGHAMEKNIEAGLLVRGGHIPFDIGRHLQGLVDVKIISAVTGN